MENFTYKDFTLQWHITHRCNLRCKHCYQEDYSAFEDIDKIKPVLSQYSELIKQYNCIGRLNITGGEPLTHPGLYDLLDLARLKGMRTGVLTNGTLLGEWEARRLKACGVDYVQISLDGLEKTHDMFRKPGSFKATLEAIKLIKESGMWAAVMSAACMASCRFPLRQRR